MIALATFSSKRNNTVFKQKKVAQIHRRTLQISLYSTLHFLGSELYPTVSHYTPLCPTKRGGGSVGGVYRVYTVDGTLLLPRKHFDVIFVVIFPYGLSFCGISWALRLHPSFYGDYRLDGLYGLYGHPQATPGPLLHRPCINQWDVHATYIFWQRLVHQWFVSQQKGSPCHTVNSFPFDHNSQHLVCNII